MYTYEEFKSGLLSLINETEVNDRNWLSFVARLIVFLGFGNEEVRSITNDENNLCAENIEFLYRNNEAVYIYVDGTIVYEIPICGAIHESTIIALHERESGRFSGHEKTRMIIRDIFNKARQSNDELLAYLYARCFDQEESNYEEGVEIIKSAINAYVECEVAKSISQTFASTNAVIIGGATSVKEECSETKTKPARIAKKTRAQEDITSDENDVLNFLTDVLDSPENPHRFTPVIENKSGYVAIQRNEHKRSWVFRAFLNGRKKSLVCNDEAKTRILIEKNDEARNAIIKAMDNVFLN